MTTTKTCPKCNAEMKENSITFGIPALNDPKYAPAEQINTRVAAPVHVWHCSHCNLVEMYAVVDPKFFH